MKVIVLSPNALDRPARRFGRLQRGSTPARVVEGQIAGSVVADRGNIGEDTRGVVEGEIELQTTGRVFRMLGVDELWGEMALVDSSR